jgi:hypothetical protein
MAPGAAQGALRAVPGLHLEVGGLTADLVATQQDSTTAASGSSVTSSQGSARPASASPSGDTAGLDAFTLTVIPDGVHSVSTPSQENCGRFGNGFHGGKHLMTCPNRPFPPPANR